MPVIPKREPFFECVFVCDRNEYVFHFRAWNAAEAEHHLREQLRAHGVTASGELRVRDPRGGPARYSAHLPDRDGLRA